MTNENFYNIVNLFDGLATIFIDVSIIVTVSIVGAFMIRDWINNDNNK